MDDAPPGPTTLIPLVCPVSFSSFGDHIKHMAPGTRLGSRRHTAAKFGTTDYALAFHRACDSQPRDRSCSAVGCPALRRCAQSTRFRQWSVQRPSVTISNISTATVKRDGINGVSASGLPRGAPQVAQESRILMETFMSVSRTTPVPLRDRVRGAYSAAAEHPNEKHAFP